MEYNAIWNATSYAQSIIPFEQFLIKLFQRNMISKIEIMYVLKVPPLFRNSNLGDSLPKGIYDVNPVQTSL